MGTGEGKDNRDVTLGVMRCPHFSINGDPLWVLLSEIQFYQLATIMLLLFLLDILTMLL